MNRVSLVATVAFVALPLLVSCAAFRLAMADAADVMVETCEIVESDGQPDPRWVTLTCLGAKTAEPVLRKIARPAPSTSAAPSSSALGL